MIQIGLFGVIAGLTAALLFAAPLGGTVFAFPLFLLASLPIAIAGLGWGSLAGGVALIAASLAIGAFFSPLAAVLFVCLSGGPIFWLARLTVLSRPTDAADPSRGHEWYPLGRILLHAAFVVAGGIVIAGFLTGFDPDALAIDLADSLARWLAAAPDFGPAPTADQLLPFVRVNLVVMPYVIAALGLLLVIFNLWLGAVIAKASGRFARPAERLWTVALPNAGPIGFIVALGAALLPGPPGEVAGAFAGSLGCAVAIVGLAVLHAVTQGSGARSFILGLTYMILFVFGFPIVLFALLGLGESFFHLRARRFGGAPRKD